MYASRPSRTLLGNTLRMSSSRPVASPLARGVLGGRHVDRLTVSNIYTGYSPRRNGTLLTTNHTESRGTFPVNRLHRLGRPSLSAGALPDARLLASSPYLSDVAATVVTLIAGVLAVSSIKWLENNGILHKVRALV